MIWVWQFKDNPDFIWDDQIMINTNDGYLWAAGAQQVLEGLHMDNPRIHNMLGYATIFFTVLFTKITPFSLETVILYMPAVISSMVVVPIILIARLYGQSLWGFFAALLGSIAWSYYNRTMIGYYDTDMFSAMAPMFILYFLMKSTMDFTFRSALWAAMAIAIYPFLYNAGNSIVYAIGIIYALYMVFYHREDRVTYISIVLVFLALVPFPIAEPFNYMVKIAILIGVYVFLTKFLIEQKKLIVISGILFFTFMYFGNVFNLIQGKVLSYLTGGAGSNFFIYLVPNIITLFIILVGIYIVLILYKVEQKQIIKILSIISVIFFGITIILSIYFNITIGYFINLIFPNTVNEGLHFYGVHQTIREAGKIPFSTFANRISGSQLGVLIAFIGYVVLVLRHRAFLLALPLVGIGVFALWGGLRFTVYAVPVAAMSAVYLFFVMGEFFKDKKAKYALVVLGTIAMIYPNITHIIEYKVPTVLNKAEVADLDKLRKISDPEDYTLAWWDYGYPIWYYSETSTLIDGGKHQNDNFIISTIMQTSSSALAANLSRLAVETYAEGVDSYDKYIDADKDESKIAQKFKMFKKDGEAYHAGGGPVSNHLFRNKQKDQLDPNMLLSELESGNYKLPKKTRDIYLYLPYRMLRIFPTVAVFGNLDLTTGNKKREITFHPTSASTVDNGIVVLRNGIVFDSKKGSLKIGKETVEVKHFITTQNTKDGQISLSSHMYHIDGKYTIVHMKSYGQFIVMDTETFNSMYVKMFILGKYDKNLFELVVSSAYSKIYKLKI